MDAESLSLGIRPTAPCAVRKGEALEVRGVVLGLFPVAVAAPRAPLAPSAVVHAELGLLLQVLLVDVLVLAIPQVGHELRGDLAPQKLLPVDQREEGVALHLVAVHQALLLVTDQELRDQVPGVRGHLRGKSQGLVQDEPVHLVGVLRVERRNAHEHLVQQNPQSPPIDGLPVARPFKNLRSNVLGSSAEGEGLLLRGHRGLRQPEVRQAGVPTPVQHHVLRFQVPVDDVLTVEVVQGRGHLGGVQAGPGKGESALCLEGVEELPSRKEVEDEVESISGLKSKVQPNDEGVLDVLQNGFLSFRVCDHLFPNHHILPESLHGVHLLSALPADFQNFTKRTTAEHL
eukprot:RCo053038